MLNRYRIVLLLLVGLLLLSATFANGSKETTATDLLSSIKAKGEMVVAMEGAWAPWTYHDASDKLVGFDTDVSAAVAAKLGVKATYVEGEWDGLFAGLDAKRYDVIANGVEVTPERSQKYDFTVPYGYIKTALIVREDRTDIQSFEDLKGKTTCNSLGSTYSEMAEAYGAKAIGVDTLDETLALVLAGRADATLNAEVSFYDYMKVHPEAPLKVVALTKEASEVSMPLRKGEETKALKEAIDKAIEELRADGTLSKISIQYFDTDISGKN